MEIDRPSWPARLLRVIPPFSDGVWLGFLLLMVLLLGIAAGMTWCLHTQQQAVSRFAVQHQLDALEKRLKAVEPR